MTYAIRPRILAVAIAAAVCGAADAADVGGSPDDAPDFRLVFPAGAQAKNVRAYGARGDGKSDDTAAIQLPQRHGGTENDQGQLQ